MTKIDLLKFHEKIVEKYKKGEYRKKYNTIMFPDKKSITDININEEEYSLYALNYMIFEYCSASKDKRWEKIINVILVPVGSTESMEKISLKKYKIDFNLCDFEVFYEFMIDIKNV